MLNLPFSNYSGWRSAVGNTLRLKPASYAEFGNKIEQAGAELGQAQVKLEFIVEVAVEVTLKLKL